MDPTFRLPRGAGGEYAPPPDKSITHRALMLAAISSAVCRVGNPLATGDCISTRRCLEALGASFQDSTTGIATRGVGLRGFRQPRRVLEAENSGTTTRLLSGLLAGLPVFAVLSGDDSLLARPMGRVVEPLRAMGARIEGRDRGRFAPLCFLPGTGDLAPISWPLPVPSAQVKSSLLLAALRAGGECRIGGLIGSRDHTERMLRALGVRVEQIGGELVTGPVAELPGFEMDVPGDISSAAFFLAAAMISGRKLTVRGCGVNPTRCGLLEVLRRMGARIVTREEACILGEPVGTITAEPGELRGTRVTAAEVPELIDEVPLLAVLGLFARGTTEVRGAEELRFKESDRLKMIAEMAVALGGRIEVFSDGFSVDGPQVLRASDMVDPRGDHRIAMAAAVAAAGIPGGVKVKDFACARVSYPDFARDFIALGGEIA
jgi:3-phosphoshikimate 1-carboxyvinyltransferase